MTAGLIAMTDLAGCFFRVQQVSLHGRSMCVVAHAALLDHGGLVSMDLRKLITLVAIETATFDPMSQLTPEVILFRCLWFSILQTNSARLGTVRSLVPRPLWRVPLSR